MNSTPLLPRPLAGYHGRASSAPARSACTPSRVHEPVDCELGKRRWRAAAQKRIRAWEQRGASTPGARWPEAPLSPQRPALALPRAKEHAPQCSGLRALRAGAAGDRGCQGVPGRGSRGTREPVSGAESQPGARWWVPPKPRARQLPRLPNLLALGSRDACTAKQPEEPREPRSTAVPRRQAPAANLLGGGYVTFHRSHCGCQEEQ
ncbi:uncharacterized protein [Symphalangus syndactylus]|uniref:uncharacterized protein n=1 Tax=Symphalangus syndactylus TaxID=9590 RepID=UPI0030045FA4